MPYDANADSSSPCPVCAGVQTLETSDGCANCSEEMAAARAYARGGTTLEEAGLPSLFGDEIGAEMLRAFSDELGF